MKWHKQGVDMWEAVNEKNEILFTILRMNNEYRLNRRLFYSIGKFTKFESAKKVAELIYQG